MFADLPWHKPEDLPPMRDTGIPCWRQSDPVLAVVRGDGFIILKANYYTDERKLLWVGVRGFIVDPKRIAGWTELPSAVELIEYLDDDPGEPNSEEVAKEDVSLMHIGGGDMVDLDAILDGDLDQISLAGIARGLANQCRYGGHVAKHRNYSVAQHSVLVSIVAEHIYEAPIEVVRCGLLHDASEAYLVDIPSPVKRRPELAGYRQLEERLQEVIARRFDIPYPYPDIVHEIDQMICHLEAEQVLQNADVSGWGLPDLHPRLKGRQIPNLFPWEAEDRFLHRAYELGVQ